MTRNFVPLHVFLRHETEWQSVRQAPAGQEEADTHGKPPNYLGDGDAAKRGTTSAARPG